MDGSGSATIGGVVTEVGGCRCVSQPEPLQDPSIPGIVNGTEKVLNSEELLYRKVPCSGAAGIHGIAEVTCRMPSSLSGQAGRESANRR